MLTGELEGGMSMKKGGHRMCWSVSWTVILSKDLCEGYDSV